MEQCNLQLIDYVNTKWVTIIRVIPTVSLGMQLKFIHTAV